MHSSEKNNYVQNKISPYILTTLGLIPILFFFFTLHNHVINLPVNDDYDTTLLYLKQFFFDDWDKGQNFYSMILKQHNEHRILLSRLTAISFYLVNQKINFTYLIYFQNLLLLCAAVGMVKISNTKSYDRTWVILLISFSFFCLSIWQSAFFYYGGIQHFSSFFFSLVSLAILNQKGHKYLNFALAIFFAFIATFSFGNGILVMPMGFMLLWFNGEKKRSYVWLIFTLMFVAMYIQGLNFNQHHNPPFQFYSFIKFFFTFLGASFYAYSESPFINTINISVCMIVGVIIFLTWILLFVKGHAKKQALLYVLLTICIGTGFLLAFSRSDFKAAGGIISRYNFFSKCLIVLFLLNINAAFKLSQGFKISLLAILACVWLFCYINLLPQIKHSQTATINEFSEWKSGKSLYLVPEYQNSRFGDALKWADQQHIFKIPSDLEIENMETKYTK